MEKKADLFEQKPSGVKPASAPPAPKYSRGPLTEEQIAELKKPLDESRIQRRKAQFGTVEYLQTHDIIVRANEIFGFGGWQREIKRLERIYQEEVEGVYNVGYLCEYRIKVGDVVHEDVGFGSSANQHDLAQAHETAVKGAVSDALKRCFRAFGPQFGLGLGLERREEYQPAEPSRITENQLNRLHRELKSYNLKEEDLLEYVNLKMGSDFKRLEELPLKVASRAIERFAANKEEFAKEIKALTKKR